MIRASAPVHVVCAGGAVADTKLQLLAAPVTGTSNPARAASSFGGVARNVAENLAALFRGVTGPGGPGGRVELVSAVGDDPAGAALLQHLGACGVGTRHVAVVPGAATAQYVAILRPDGGLTLGAAAMEILDGVTAGAIDAAWPGDGWLFVDTNLPAAVLEHILARARDTGTPVAADAVSAPKVTRLPARLDGLALLSCTSDEARAWLARHGHDSTGIDRRLAQRLCALGASAVLLTRGAQGVVAADADGVQIIPAVHARPVDVTGAGDALVGGAIAVLVDGGNLLDAARAGAQRAARTIESRLSVLP